MSLKNRVFSKVFLFTCVSLWSMQTMAYIVNGNATINSTTPGLSNNTTQSGIQMTAGGDYTLTVSSDINLSNNSGSDPAGYGMYVIGNSTLNFVGENGNETISILNSAQRGAHFNGDTTLTFKDLNLTVANTLSKNNGICAHGAITLTGNGDNLLKITGSSDAHGLHVYSNEGYNTAHTTITDMNIEISGNANGIGLGGQNLSVTAGRLDISSSTGNNTMVLENNSLTGFVMGATKDVNQTGGAIANITNMNVSINNNGQRGIDLAGVTNAPQSVMTITGNGNNLLQTNNNAYEGINIQNKNNALLIKNMNIEVNNNGHASSSQANLASGISVWGKISIEGNGNNYIQMNDNERAGFAIANDTTAGQTPQADITNMNITANSNGAQGIDISADDGTLGVVFNASSNHNNTLTANSNGLQGLRVSKGSTATIAGMNVSANQNTDAGIDVENATLNLTGTGSNTLQLTQNGKEGLVVDGGTATISNMNILVNSNGTASSSGTLYSGISTNGVLTMTGNGNNTLQSTYNKGAGIYVGSSATPNGSSTLTITDMNISLQGNEQEGIVVQDSKASISSTNKNNSLTLNNGSYNLLVKNEGALNAKDASLTIDGMRISSGANNKFAYVGSESIAYQTSLSINDSSLNLGNNNQVFELSTGHVELNNVNQTGSAPTYLVSNTGISSFNAHKNSSVSGKITDNGQLTTTIADNSNWKMHDTSNTYNLTLNNSSIDMRSTSGGYNKLTVGNAYLANNATLYMNTNLDETQLTDQLVLLNGSHVVGKTNLSINNTAPASSYGTFIKGDGIKVVDAQGSTFTGPDSFDLVGKKIDTGLYIQELYYQNLGTDDESWYIRTATDDNGGGNQGSDGSYSNGDKPKATDLTKTVASMPAVALSVVKTINSELRNRLGELRSNNPNAKEGLWVRGYAKSLEVDEKIKNEMDIYGFEAGFDHLISKSNQARTYLGIMAGYAQVDKLKVDQANGYKGKGDGTVPSIGAYLTWINKNGWYTDTVVRGFLTKLDITNYSAQGLPITYDSKRMAVTGSFEFGRRTALYQKGRNGFIIEPKAQVVYTYMPSKDHKTSLGQKIKYDTTQSLVTRAALMAAYRRTFANGMALEPYVQVGVAYEWLGKTDVNFIGSDFTSDVSGATFEGVLGLNARLTRGWHLYGDLTVEKGSVYDSFGGHLGVRYNF